MVYKHYRVGKFPSNIGFELFEGGNQRKLGVSSVEFVSITTVPKKIITVLTKAQESAVLLEVEIFKRCFHIFFLNCMFTGDWIDFQ